jgi:hypothetical protein
MRLKHADFYVIAREFSTCDNKGARRGAAISTSTGRAGRPVRASVSVRQHALWRRGVEWYSEWFEPH